jgi:hypothetical protein
VGKKRSKVGERSSGLHCALAARPGVFVLKVDPAWMFSALFLSFSMWLAGFLDNYQVSMEYYNNNFRIRTEKLWWCRWHCRVLYVVDFGQTKRFSNAAMYNNAFTIIEK